MFIKKSLPEYETPTFFNSNNYVRTGNNIVLYADSNYYKLFPIDKVKIWTHHAFEPYLYLCDQYLDSTASTIQHKSPSTVILQAAITNKTLLDSIVIYDKENSWKIISSLKFILVFSFAFVFLTDSYKFLYRFSKFSKYPVFFLETATV
jgi:hypothetical protein